MSKKTIIAVMLIIMSGLVVAGCSGGKKDEGGTKAPEAPEVEARLIKVEKKTMPDGYLAVGTVRSESTVTVSAKIMGFVKDLRVAEGDEVSAGQVLIELDAAEINAKLKQAEAGYDEARSALDEVESGVASAESGVKAASAGRELAEATFRRYEVLVEKDSVSKQEFDEVKARTAVARAEEERARKGFAAMESKKQQVLAKIGQARAGVSEAKVMLGYAEVRSPMKGIVLEKNVEMGTLASPGMPLLIVEDNSSYRLEATVDESKVEQIMTGDEVQVKIDAISGEGFAGGVEEIRPSSDAGSRTFTVKISLPSDKRLRSGLYGRASFEMGERDKILIPAEAVIKKGMTDGVFVVDEKGISRFRVIKAADAGGGAVEVFSGLDAGEMIAVSNVGKIMDGGKVRAK